MKQLLFEGWFFMKQLFSHKGFTLVEVLVGLTIVSIISAASFTTVSILTKSTEASRNRIIAVNFMQKSMEEVRRVAQTEFDNLETCAFPAGAVTTGDACGFEPTLAEFPDFSRTLTVADEYLNSEELKRVTVTTNWSEMGVARSLTNVILLSRPPDPLPGDIWGKVYREGNEADLLSNANISVTKVDGTDNQNAISKGVLDTDGHNYDFKEAVSGQFKLEAGSWTMHVTRSGFEDYDYPGTIEVPPGGPPVTVDIPMTALPEPAHVTYQLYDGDTGANIGNFNYGYVYLREGSGSWPRFNQNRYRDPNHTFEIPFGDPNDANYHDPICMTLFTWRTTRASYAYRVNSLGPQSCTYDYNPNGWSSSYVRDDAGTLMCANPHWDTSNAGGIDRICVHPGDNITVRVPLHRVPFVTVTGRLQNYDTTRDFYVYVRYPRNLGTDWVYQPYYRRVHIPANPAGEFSIQVPAAQSLTANGDPYNYYTLIRPYAYVNYTACCESDVGAWTWYEGLTNAEDYRPVGPLFEGDTPRDAGVFVMPGHSNAICGDAEGEIVDAKTGGAIHLADVNIRGAVDGTNGAGKYQHKCQGAGYRIDAAGGNQRVRVTYTRNPDLYYDLDTNGNTYYSSKTGIDIIPNNTASWNGKLWPIGRGTVRVTVLDRSTMVPIVGATVTLYPYNGGSTTAVTDGSGLAIFNNVLETWPPPSMDPLDTYYNHTVRNHSVSVTGVPGNNYILPVSGSVENLNDGGIVDVQLTVAPKGAM